MNTKQTVILVAGFLIFMLIIAFGIFLEEGQETEQMKACVAAGKEWVRDFGNHYECVTPK